VPNVGEAWYDLTARTSKLRGALDDADRRVSGSVRNAEHGFGRRVTGAIGRMGGALTTAVKTAGVIGVAGAAGLGFLGGMAIKAAADLETMQVQWEVLLGSTEAAKERMAELREFAATTPFEIPEVMAASRQLQVFGGTTLATGKNLTLVGDIAAGTQQPFTDVAMWVGRMYDALKSGQPFGEAAMRLQEMGALSGENRRVIEKLAEGVKDGSLTMDEAWSRTSGVFGQFGGLMEKQSKTTAGQWSNLMDNLGQTLAGIGQILLPFAKSVIGGMNEALPAIRETLINVFEVAGPIVEKVVGVISDVVGNLISFFVENWPLISEVVGTVVGHVQRVIETWVGALTPLFAWIVQNVVPPLIEVFSNVMAWVAQHWPQISAIIERAVNIIGGVIKLLWPIIKQTARVVLPILGAAFEVILPVIDTMLGVLEGFIGFLTDPFMPTVEGIAETFAEVWQAVSGFFSAVWNGMLQALGQIVGTMIGIIKNVVGIAAEIPGPWQEGAKKQKAALESMEEAAKSWGTQTTRTLDTTFEEQRQLAATGGTNTARAYADGIASQEDYLFDQTHRFAGSAGRLLEAFSPPKYGPLKDIDKWGASTADAYAEGWASRGANLRRVIADTLSGHVARVGPGVASLSGAAGAGSGGTLTFSPQFNSILPYSPRQAQQAVRAIMPEFTREARRQGLIR
jgi:hypothetical protein